MFKVVIKTPESQEARSFSDKPSAMNCAVHMLSRFGTTDSNVTIQAADGAVVFAHQEILRAYQCVRA
jgi:hypothetical protein